jgi:hypothetical protein
MEIDQDNDCSSVNLDEEMIENDDELRRFVTENVKYINIYLIILTFIRFQIL